MSSTSNRQRKRRSFGRFEALESRLAMAGNVTSTLANGALGLTGDNLANHLRFESNGVAGEFLVTGLNDAATNTPTLIDGLATKVFSGVTSLSIELNDGNDQVLAKNFSLESLSILAAAGDDRIDIGQYVPLTTPNPIDNVQVITGSLYIETGIGADTIGINYLYGDATVGIISPNVTDTNSQGHFELSIYVAFFRNLSVTVANVADTVNSNDVISLGYVTAITQFPGGSSCQILTGGGDDLISIYASRFGIGGGFPDIGINGGSGNDYLALDVNIIEGNIGIYGGDGDDTIQFSRNVGLNSGSIGGNIVLDGGTGDDNVLVGKYYAVEAGQPVLRDAGSAFSVSLTIHLGSGNDTVNLTANIIEFLVIYMGSDSDYAFLGSNIINNIIIYGEYYPHNGIPQDFDRVRRFNNSILGTTYLEFLGIEESTFGPPL